MKPYIKYQYENGLFYHTIITILYHITFLFGIIYYGFSLTAISIILLAYFLSLLSEEIALHRYYTHNSFETNKEYLIFLLSVVCSFGPPIWFVGTHKLHHKYSDTEKDPHSPRFKSPISVWLSYWNHYKIPFSLIKPLCKDRKQILLMRYYIPLWISLWFISLFLFPFFTCFFCGGLTVVYHLVMAVNVISHINDENKTYPEAHGSNNKLLVLLTFGAANHNIHHKYPGRYIQNPNGEFDLVGLIIKYMFAKTA